MPVPSRKKLTVYTGLDYYNVVRVHLSKRKMFEAIRKTYGKLIHDDGTPASLQSITDRLNTSSQTAVYEVDGDRDTPAVKIQAHKV